MQQIKYKTKQQNSNTIKVTDTKNKAKLLFQTTWIGIIGAKSKGQSAQLTT